LALQLRLTWLLEMAVAFNPLGIVGALQLPLLVISMPLALALSVTVTYWITNWPLEFALALNCSTIALFLAPAAAMMSKLVSTWVPLIKTLNTRCPAMLQKNSAKCSRTVYGAPGLNPGMV